MKTIIAALAFALALTTCAPSAPSAPSTLRFPRRYAAEYRMLSCYNAPPYFHCDYTSKTCLRGLMAGGMFVGQVLAEDRKTVINHVRIQNGTVISYDTGMMTEPGTGMPPQQYLQEDQPSDEEAHEEAPGLPGYMPPAPPPGEHCSAPPAD